MTTTSSSPPHEVALVGLGRIAVRHIAAIEAMPEAYTLTHVVEPDRARHIPQGASWVPSFDALLETAAPKIIVLCSPSGAHAEQARRALESGAHVLCEKPLAMDGDETRALLALARHHDRLLIPCYQTRQLPLFTHLHEAVTRGELGEIHTVNLSVQWSRPQRYFDEEPWRGSLANDGGVLINQVSHLLDWMLAVINTTQLEEIFAWERVLRRSVEAPDSVTMCWRGARAQGTLSATVLAEPANFEATLTVLGDRGSVQLGGPHAHHIVRWDVPAHPLSFAQRDALHARTRVDRDEGHQGIYRGMARWLCGEERVALEVLQRGARDVAHCIDLVRTSSQTGRPVRWAPLTRRGP